MKIYCDGSANPNPGPGGFGVIALDKSEKIVYHIHRESSKDTTNNREELKAILYCLKKFGVKVEKEDDFLLDIPDIYSDSAYAIGVFTTWMFSWSRNNWIRPNGEEPDNLDIIKEYFDLWNQGYIINIHKIKGHSGNYWHDFVDKMAANKIPLSLLKDKIE